ncbi:MAG: N-acetyltransferase family protein [Polaromonas sp.]
MQIRRLEPADAADYQRFRLRSLREHPEAFTSAYEEVLLQPLSTPERRLALPDEKVWGAFEGGVLAGMIGLNHETRRHNRHKATLVGMYVASEFAGHGLGQALMQTVLQEARDGLVELIVLTVTEGNQAALALYRRAGFSAFGIEPDAVRVRGVSHGKIHMAVQLPGAAAALRAAK